MIRVSSTIAILVVLFSTLFIDAGGQRTRPQRPDVGPQAAPEAEQITPERTISTQQRINRYFHSDVVPKLSKCWSEIKDKGTITFEYEFTKTMGGWRLPKLSVARSTLSREQQAVAMRCMTAAIRGTSFPSVNAETKEKTFLINWTWPAPFPADSASRTSAMFAAKPVGGGTGTGGCDGEGAPAACNNCIVNGTVQECKKVCVGYKTCTVQLFPNGASACTKGGQCASGGPFGTGGGTVMQ